MEYDVSEAEFLLSLLKEFCIDGKESLDACEGVLLNLEKSDGSDVDEYMNELMRLIHSIKGSAKAVELKSMTQALHLYESYCQQKDDNFIDTSFIIIDKFREALTLISDDAASQGDVIFNETIAILTR